MTEINENTQKDKKGTRKRIIPLVLLVAVAVGGLSFGALRAQGEGNAADAPAGAAKSVASASAQDAWAVRCGDIKDGEKTAAQYCEMVQSISVTQQDAEPATAQRLIEMAIGYPPSEKGKAFAAVILPLGIQVNKDVEIDIDGAKAVDFEISYCDVGGCIASFHIDGKDMDKLAKGSTMTVKTLAATGQPVAIEMSLAGFGKARDKIKAGKS